MSKVSIPEVVAALPAPWQPQDLAMANDTMIRIARLHGEFPGTTTTRTNCSSAGKALSASNCRTASR
ncbi:hypothetical protein [Nocardia sp. NPDC004260]